MPAATGIVTFDAEFGDDATVVNIRVREGDAGRPFHATCKENGAVLDVSGAAITLRTTDNHGTAREYAMTNVGDGTDGKVKATLNGGSFTGDGAWTLILRLVEGGLDIHSEPIHLNIGRV